MAFARRLARCRSYVTFVLALAAIAGCGGRARTVPQPLRSIVSYAMETGDVRCDSAALGPNDALVLHCVDRGTASNQGFVALVDLAHNAVVWRTRVADDDGGSTLTVDAASQTVLLDETVHTVTTLVSLDATDGRRLASQHFNADYEIIPLGGGLVVQEMLSNNMAHHSFIMEARTLRRLERIEGWPLASGQDAMLFGGRGPYVFYDVPARHSEPLTFNPPIDGRSAGSGNFAFIPHSTDLGAVVPSFTAPSLVRFDSHGRGRMMAHLKWYSGDVQFADDGDAFVSGMTLKSPYQSTFTRFSIDGKRLGSVRWPESERLVFIVKGNTLLAFRKGELDVAASDPQRFGRTLETLVRGDTVDLLFDDFDPTTHVLLIERRFHYIVIPLDGGHTSTRNAAFPWPSASPHSR